MQFLPKDIRRLLMLQYCSANEWVKCIQASKLFSVLTEKEKRLRYGELLVKKQRIRHKVRYGCRLPIFYAPRSNYLSVSEPTNGNGKIIIRPDKKYLCGICAQIVRATHLKTHNCSMEIIQQTIEKFSKSTCLRCNVRVEKWRVLSHQKNECKSYKCPHCQHLLIGVNGVSHHAKICRLLQNEVWKFMSLNGRYNFNEAFDIEIFNCIK